MIPFFHSSENIRLYKSENLRILKILAGAILANIIIYILFSYLALGHL